MKQFYRRYRPPGIYSLIIPIGIGVGLIADILKKVPGEKQKK